MKHAQHLLVLTLVAGAVAATAAQASAVTIGQTGLNGTCAATTILATSGSLYTVPDGSWQITSWSTLANDSPGEQMAALVLRPLGGGSYRVVAKSATQMLTPNVLNTFAASLAAQGGDILADWGSDGSACGVLGGSNTYGYVLGPAPSVGDTLTPAQGPQSSYPNISATLGSPSAPVPRPPDRFGYCSAGGNTWQDGSAIPPGTFLNLLWEQPDNDSHYTGATIANFVWGLGITCDNPPAGYVRDGYATDDMHVPGGTYPLWVPAASS
jgi:hypothetical protein